MPRSMYAIILLAALIGCSVPETNAPAELTMHDVPAAWAAAKGLIARHHWPATLAFPDAPWSDGVSVVHEGRGVYHVTGHASTSVPEVVPYGSPVHFECTVERSPDGWTMTSFGWVNPDYRGQRGGN